MAELVFNIYNIFNSADSDGCLEQHSASHYYIPSYQRGYKWGALHETDPVRILMKDLHEAFTISRKNPNKEYYLQYITVKRPVDDAHLEVIDGQQRLTTLSILLSVLSRRIQGINNIAVNKLDYAIRENFFSKHIYPVDALAELLNARWDKETGIYLKGSNGVSEGTAYNSQDIFYISEAAKAIDHFISESIFETELLPFYEFLTSNVFIIVNAVEPYVSSEQVFNNLNSNKVPLTEPELIKALFLTKAAREKDGRHQTRHFKEILELRAAMGRIWDEISRWINDDAVKSFFFDENDGMKGLLKLLAIKMGYRTVKDEKDSHHPLFNFFHKQTELNGVFENLKQYYNILKGWYVKDAKYNLLGFAIFAKGSKHKKHRLKLISELLDLDQDEFKKRLKEIRVEHINVDLSQLFYDAGSTNEEIHRILLAVNVFSVDASKVTRFDFFAFKDHGWSLEHVFSQKPEGNDRQLTPEDIKCIKGILGDDLTDKLQKILDKDTRSTAEQEIYYDALQKNNLINSIGNMSLLTGADNSSNSNGQFDDKRTNILELVRSGKFVPKHTFEVFSKIILPNPGNLRSWSKLNIDEHADYIIKTIDKLKLTPNA